MGYKIVFLCYLDPVVDSQWLFHTLGAYLCFSKKIVLQRTYPLVREGPWFVIFFSVLLAVS